MIRALEDAVAAESPVKGLQQQARELGRLFEAWPAIFGAAADRRLA